MDKLSPIEKSEILEKILNSAEFRDSKRYQDLLKYIVEKSESEEFLKEIEIAIDVFGKDSNFDPNTNSQIRAYVSNLRKKLEHYYLTTEDLFTYKLEIPRGQYTVKYVHVDSVNYRNGFKKKLPYIYVAIIIGLLCILFIREIAHLNQENIKPVSITQLNPVWNDFFRKDSKPTTIVLGDYVFFTGKNSNDDRIFLRNTKINSEKDFQDFKKKNPEFYSQYELLKFTYLRPSAPYGLFELMNLWDSNSRKNVSLKLASQLKWEDFDDHNVIFIGTFKTLYKIDTLFSKSNIKYSVEPSSLSIIDNNKDTVNYFKVNWHASSYQDDYSVVIKIPGSKNNSILFFMGFSEIGVLEAVKTATDPNFINRMENYLQTEITNNPIYFQMVSHLEGVELTAFRTEIKYFDLLEFK